MKKSTLIVTHTQRIIPGFWEASGRIAETGQRIGNAETTGRTQKQAVYKLWKYANEMYGPVTYPKSDK